MIHRSLEQALLAMGDEGEDETELRGEAAGADCPSGAGSGAGKRQQQPHADCSAAAASQMHRPAAITVLQLPAALSGTPTNCTDGDDELSESSTAAAADGSRESGGCSSASAGAASPSLHQRQLTSKASYRAQHELLADGMKNDGSDDANGTGDPPASQPLTRHRRSSSRIRRRSRSRSTRRRVFANPTFPADSPDSDDCSSSDESQWSSSIRLLRGRSQLCELLAGGRCRSLRGLLIRTAMRPAEVKGKGQWKQL